MYKVPVEFLTTKSRLWLFITWEMVIGLVVGMAIGWKLFGNLLGVIFGGGLGVLLCLERKGVTFWRLALLWGMYQVRHLVRQPVLEPPAEPLVQTDSEAPEVLVITDTAGEPLVYGVAHE